jgi:hypothetical protein
VAIWLVVKLASWLSMTCRGAKYMVVSRIFQGPLLYIYHYLVDIDDYNSNTQLSLIVFFLSYMWIVCHWVPRSSKELYWPLSFSPVYVSCCSNGIFPQRFKGVMLFFQITLNQSTFEILLEYLVNAVQICHSWALPDILRALGSVTYENGGRAQKVSF